MDSIIEQIKEKEIEKFQQQLVEHMDEIEKLNDSIGEYPSLKMKPSDRFLHPIKYRKAQKQLEYDRYIYTSDLKEIQNKINEHKKNVDLLTRVIREDPLKNVDLAHESSIVEYCMQNGIEIKYDTVQEALEKMPNYFTRNVSFMIEAVKENPLYMGLDNTNDLSVLKETISTYISKYKDELMGYINEYSELLEVLNKEELTEEDKKLCTHFLDLVKYEFKPLLERQQYSKSTVVPYIPSYQKVKEVYETTMSKVLEEYYESGKYTIGIHGTYENFEGENPIFKDGLKNSNQGSTKRTLSRTVAYDIPFINVIYYHGITRPQGYKTELHNYVMLLPKDVNKSPVWGSNEKNSNDNYVLPEYVIGYYEADKGKDTMIIPNEIIDKTKYQYLFADEANYPLEMEEQKQSL